MKRRKQTVIDSGNLIGGERRICASTGHGNRESDGSTRPIENGSHGACRERGRLRLHEWPTASVLGRFERRRDRIELGDRAERPVVSGPFWDNWTVAIGYTCADRLAGVWHSL